MNSNSTAMMTTAERCAGGCDGRALADEQRTVCWRAVLRPVAWLLAIGMVTWLLVALHAAYPIAPNVESDNAYIFLAADRLYDGLGPTSLPPKAPNQPWEWHSDWAFLTQWPVGYPALICALRWASGTTTIHAAIALNILCGAIGLVAWFAWIRACLPRRNPAWLIGLLAAASTFSVSNLVNPSSDAVLLGLLPVVLLAADHAISALSDGRLSGWRRTLAMASVGLFAGALFWIRYAALFVPVAIGVYLVAAWLIQRRVRFRDVAVYAVASLAPMLALVTINHVYGAAQSVQEQLNLGHLTSVHFEPAMLVTAWEHFTEQTLYAHRPEAKWFFLVVLPVAALGLPLFLQGVREEAVKRLKRPAGGLSVAATVALFAVLIGATTFFGDKYDYVGLDRYYQPIRPFYFLFFVGPVALVRPRSLRLLACVPLLLALSWFLNQDARRTLDRWTAADRPVTDYGRWSRRFEPNSRTLYAWLAGQKGEDLAVFSNFHDDIAVETGIPTSPTPANGAQLRRWLGRIQAARGQADLHVLFVLDPDNDHRSGYLSPPEEIVERLHLVPCSDAPESIRPHVFVQGEG